MAGILGGEAVLFTSAATIDDSQIAVLSLDTREQKVLVRGGSYPRYSRRGTCCMECRGICGRCHST